MSTAHEKLIIAAIDRHRKECSIFHSEDRVTRSATGARLTADRPVDSAQSYVKNTSRYFLDAILISRNLLKLVLHARKEGYNCIERKISFHEGILTCPRFHTFVRKLYLYNCAINQRLVQLRKCVNRHFF